MNCKTGSYPVNESLEHAYDRLNRRRKKLDLLRRKVYVNDRALDRACSFESNGETVTFESTHVFSSLTNISNSKKNMDSNCRNLMPMGRICSVKN